MTTSVCICNTCKKARREQASKTHKFQMLRLFGRKKTSDIPAWSPKPEEFMGDNLDGYLNPHQRSVLQEVCSFLPPSAREHTLIAGGFAAYVAGITKSSSDVDLFCVNQNIFVELADKIPGEMVKERRGYGTVIKFERNNIKYDLVDSTPRLDYDSRNVIGLLSSFDINWCMAAIHLGSSPATSKIICHPNALSNTPVVNNNRADEHIECVIWRLEKYSKRLVRTVDPEYLKRLIKDIRTKQKKKDKASRNWY